MAANVLVPAELSKEKCVNRGINVVSMSAGAIKLKLTRWRKQT